MVRPLLRNFEQLYLFPGYAAFPAEAFYCNPAFVAFEDWAGLIVLDLEFQSCSPVNLLFAAQIPG